MKRLSTSAVLALTALAVLAGVPTGGATTEPDPAIVVDPFPTFEHLGTADVAVRPPPPTSSFATSASASAGPSGDGSIDGAGSAETAGPVCNPAPLQRCPGWISRFTTKLGVSSTVATAAATSPDGSVVYQTGYSAGLNSPGLKGFPPQRWVTTAYSALDGSVVWRAEYGALPDPSDYATALAVSPDGKRVYVTGASRSEAGGLDYAAVAYAAGTGKRLWVTRYDGPAGGADQPNAIAVSRDGSRVYVTGASAQSQPSSYDVATVAFSAATGSRLWATRYDGPLHALDRALALGVSPDGSSVYVTGQTTGVTSDYVTIAYAAATGTQRWLATYDGPAHGADIALALAVAPNGTSVYVTGGSPGTGQRDWATIAYDAASGAQRWVARYVGPARGNDIAEAIAVSRDGSRVFVTGQSQGGGTRFDDFDAVTVAYGTTGGNQLWVARYNGPNNRFDDSSSIAVTPDGSRVVVSGTTNSTHTGNATTDYLTLAYDAATGAQEWAAVGDPEGSFDDQAAFTMSPDGSHVYTMGHTYQGNLGDWATGLGYDTASGGSTWKVRYMAGGDSMDGRGDSINNGLTGKVHVAVSPDGSRVYVTGTVRFLATTAFGEAIGTAAFDTGTGHLLWSALYYAPWGGAGASAIGVSPDGSRVYVTGWTDALGTIADYTTIAYDAKTGQRRWVARYDGGATDPAHMVDIPYVLAVAPDGSRVYVTGTSGSQFLPLFGADADISTVAYNAKTGAQQWVARYDGPGRGPDGAFAIGVSRDGARVFVGGTTDAGATTLDMLGLAYDAATGRLLWSARHAAANGLRNAWARNLAVAPDGSRVYLVGPGTGIDTVAIDAATGVQLFADVYPVETFGTFVAPGIAVQPNGSRVFVSAYDTDTAATIAYDARTGTPDWVERFKEPGSSLSGEPTAIAANPDGSRVYVTGVFAGTDGLGDQDFGTVAYDTATGAIQWFARDGGTEGVSATDEAVTDVAQAIAISRDGSRVYIAGNTYLHWDYLAIAYDR